MTLEQIGHAALARLAVDTDHLAVFASDIGWVQRQIGHVPGLASALFPFAEPLLDRVLVRPAEGGKDQLARVRLARRHRHASATLIDLDDPIEVT